MKQLYTCILFLVPISLLAQNQTGYIKFNFNIDSAHVIVNNNQFEWQKIASGDSLELISTRNYIVLSTPFDAPLRRRVNIPVDSTLVLTHHFSENNINPETLNENLAARNYFDSNIMVLSDEDSEIYYKGDYKGTGFAKFNAPEELAYLEIKNPDFGTTKKRLNVRGRRINFIEDYKRPIRSGAYSIAVLPGVSQFYKKQHLKGAFLSITTAVLVTYTVRKFNEYDSELYRFNNYKLEYSEAGSESEALLWGDRTDEQKIVVQQVDNQRRIFFLSSLLVYGFNIYDAITSKPRGGYLNKEKDLKFYLSQDKVLGTLGTNGTFRYNF